MESTKPLSGICVIDLTQILQGPYCAFLMAMAGAEIIKVEPLTGDRTRRHKESRVPPVAFAMLNSNKKSVTLNLRTPRGQELARALIQHSDFLIENFFSFCFSFFSLLLFLSVSLFFSDSASFSLCDFS